MWYRRGFGNPPWRAILLHTVPLLQVFFTTQLNWKHFNLFCAQAMLIPNVGQGCVLVAGTSFQVVKLLDFASFEDYVWLCVAVCGSVWPCVAVCGCVWPCMAVCGCVWPPRVIQVVCPNSNTNGLWEGVPHDRHRC